MAINGINGNNSILLTTIGNRQGGLARPANRPLAATNPAVAEAPAPPAQDAVQQNAALVNTTLRNLGSAATATETAIPIANPNPYLTVTQTTQELNPIQQSALLVNETLQNLGYTPAEPRNILLINEISPAVEAAGITQDLDLIQQNLLEVNETLQEIGVEAQAGVAPQPIPPEAQAAAPVPPAPQIAPPTPAPPEEIIPLETEELAAAIAAAAETATPVTPTVAAPVAPVPLTEIFPPRRLTPATLPVALRPDITPAAFAVYLVNDPAPPPAPPEPIIREVIPTIPVARIHPVANARLRQRLPREQQGPEAASTEYNTPRTTIVQAEKAIRYTISQANMDIDARGLPLHLVFAKHGNDFALDVYDCSQNDSCPISYDVPIQLDNLPGVLDNLQHSRGLIVNNSS